MDAINIQSTLETPEINLDSENNKFEIIGNSFPEDTVALYLPIIDWLKEYSNNPNPTTRFTFKLDYFNSSTYKAFLFVFEILEGMHPEKSEVCVEWIYQALDIDMKEAGEEFADISSVPFEFKPVEEE